MEKCIKNKKMRRFSIFNLQSSICLLVLSMFSFSIMAQDVYVGGCSSDGKAAVWKNGVPTILSTGVGYVFSVVVHEGSVYAAGHEGNTPCTHKVWKDGVELYAVIGGHYGWSHSIAVAENGDVYMTGRDDSSFKVWKNGNLAQGYENLEFVGSVFTSGDDVYVLGRKTDNTVVVMKNGMEFLNLNINSDTYAYPRSVVVVDDIIYTTVYEGVDGITSYMPKVYKDGTLLYELESTGTGPGLAFDCELGLYVSGDDVYVAGHEMRETPTVWEMTAKLWINDSAVIDLANGEFSCAYSVFKYDDDVYVAGDIRDGTVYGGGTLWINGTPTTIDGSARCVFVTPSPSSYEITLYSNPPEAGEVIGGGTFAYGDVVTVSGVPTSDYEFINWLEDGIEISTGSEYTFTVTGTRTLTGNFETYDIVILSNSPYGSVFGGGNYRPGIEITVSATVAKTGNYEFVNWTKDGVEVSTDAEYTFITAIGDMELVANFVETSLGIEEINSGVEVYPNPTDGQLRYEICDLRYEICDIIIYDIMGRNVFQVAHRTSHIANQIDISHLPIGVYFIQIQTENGMIVRKIVKN